MKAPFITGRIIVGCMPLLLGWTVMVSEVQASEATETVAGAPRIIGGTQVGTNVFPTVVKIERPDGAFGSGTLVRPAKSESTTQTRTILTAGHVLTEDASGSDDGNIIFDPQDVVVVINGQRLKPKAFFTHPKWKGGTHNEGEPDLAIIQLQDYIGIAPSELSDAVVTPPQSYLIVGFGEQGNGVTGGDKTYPPAGTVNKGNAVITTVTSPQSTYMSGTFEDTVPKQSALGGGDSGGPAFTADTRVAGVAHAGSPKFSGENIWTRVDSSREWIEQSMRIKTTDTARGTIYPASVLKALGKFSFVKPKNDQLGMIFEFVSKQNEEPKFNATFSYDLGCIEGSFHRDAKGKITVLSGPKILKFNIKSSKKEHLHLDEKVQVTLSVGPENLASSFQLQAAGLSDYNSTTDSQGVSCSASAWIKVGAITYRALNVPGNYKGKENKAGKFSIP